MNTVIENIIARRSCRSFSGDPIARGDIETLLTCARYAPCAKNQRAWKFTAVLDNSLIKRLADAVGGVLGNPKYNFYLPAAIIIPSTQESSPFGRENIAVALQNIFLAAHSLGISSVWVNQLGGQCGVPEIRSILGELGIPADHIVTGIAALGYAASSAAEPPKDCETAIIG
jgi:nitroreductase